LPDKIIVIKKWDHLHLDGMEEPYLVNRYVDHMISRPEQEVGFFGRFDPCWQEYWPAAGSADTKITVPFIDIFDNFRDNRHLAQAGIIFGMHDAI
jgi:hypothetical protein